MVILLKIADANGRYFELLAVEASTDQARRLNSISRHLYQLMIRFALDFLSYDEDYGTSTRGHKAAGAVCCVPLSVGSARTSRRSCL
jgi:hypothetical protein